MSHYEKVLAEEFQRLRAWIAERYPDDLKLDENGTDATIRVITRLEVELARLKVDAERLADEVAVLVQRGRLDSRSPAADALLDFRNPPMTPRSDRLARLESQAEASTCTFVAGVDVGTEIQFKADDVRTYIVRQIEAHHELGRVTVFVRLDPKA